MEAFANATATSEKRKTRLDTEHADDKTRGVNNIEDD